MRPLHSVTPAPAAPGDGLNATVSGLRAARETWRKQRAEAHDGDTFPSRQAVTGIVDSLAAALPEAAGPVSGRCRAEDAFVAAKLIAVYRDPAARTPTRSWSATQASSPRSSTGWRMNCTAWGHHRRPHDRGDRQ